MERLPRQLRGSLRPHQQEEERAGLVERRARRQYVEERRDGRVLAEPAQQRLPHLPDVLPGWRLLVEALEQGIQRNGEPAQTPGVRECI
jgi:hypothetical protein